MSSLEMVVSLSIYLGGGLLIGAVGGGFFGMFASIVGFDFGIWRVFWTVFWGGVWIGGAIGSLAWLIWLWNANFSSR
jgi:hypothetical protein